MNQSFERIKWVSDSMCDEWTDLIRASGAFCEARVSGSVSADGDVEGSEQNSHPVHGEDSPSQNAPVVSVKSCCVLAL